MFATSLNFYESSKDVAIIFKLIIEQSLALNASDIKIDTTEQGCSIHFKIEGRMRCFTHLPKELSPYFISYLQNACCLTVGNLEKAEDSSFYMENHRCSFRVSQLHKSYGEIIIVIRLLREGRIDSLDELNLEINFKSALRKSLLKTEGLIILAGPTDSGKTSTICAALKELDSDSYNIVSAEDPIEYKLKGVSQVQITEKLGFNKIMKQFLRLNPDVIFLGEIRDSVSAHLCIEAARTGHLVITTIHANSPQGIMKRFTDDFKVNSFDYSEFLILASSQRLKRGEDNKRYPIMDYITGGNSEHIS